MLQQRHGASMGQRACPCQPQTRYDPSPRCCPAGQITPPRTPVGLCTQSSSSRPTSAEEMTASIRAGMLRRQAAQQSRAGTPKGTPKYMLQGADFSRMQACGRMLEAVPLEAVEPRKCLTPAVVLDDQGWRPVVNHMDMRLLVGQPRPPPPPDLPPPRVHEGLPGMNNFKAVPPSSPAGLLKYVSPVEFRSGRALSVA